MAKTVKKDWSDRINPVLLKEIRQHFHNNGILSVMGGLLAAQLLLLVIVQFQVSERGDSYFGNGAVMFGFVVAGMAVAAYLICSLGTLIRFATERRERDLDFTYLTVLSPNRVIWGKLAVAIIMTVFIFSLCLPFMVIAYFLRGIEMGRMLMISLALFPAVCVASQLGILIGSSGQRWIAAAFLVASIFGSMFLVGFLFAMFSGFGGPVSPLGSLLLWYGVGGIILGTLYALSVATISPRYSNRMLPVRLSLLGIIALAPLIGLGAALVGGLSDYLKAALTALAVIGVCVSGFCATLAAFERIDPGERVLRKRPRNPVGRAVHFLISSGALGGVLLANLMMLFSGLIVFGAWLSGFSGSGGLALWISAGCYFLAYANIAILLAMKMKILPGWGWWGITVTALVVLPLLFGGVFSILFKNYIWFFFLTTPFCVSGFHSAGWGIALVGPLLALTTLLVVVRQIRAEGRRK